MQDNNHSIVISILRKEFPEVAKSIDDIITQQMPDFTLQDLALMQRIVDKFIEIYIHNDKIVWKDSKQRVWCHLSSGEYEILKVTEIRNTMMAVILMFYHPEKLLSLSKNKTSYGIVKTLVPILDCYQSEISTSLTNSVYLYKIYSGFKGEVDYIYDSIKNSLFAN